MTNNEGVIFWQARLLAPLISHYKPHETKCYPCPLIKLPLQLIKPLSTLRALFSKCSKHKLLACVGESQDRSLRSHALTAAQLASDGYLDANMLCRYVAVQHFFTGVHWSGSWLSLLFRAIRSSGPFDINAQSNTKSNIHAVRTWGGHFRCCGKFGDDGFCKSHIGLGREIGATSETENI